MDVGVARRLHEQSIVVIKELSKLALILQESNLPQEEHDLIHRGIGCSIGEVQMSIIELLYKSDPELLPEGFS